MMRGGKKKQTNKNVTCRYKPRVGYQNSPDFYLKPTRCRHKSLRCHSLHLKKQKRDELKEAAHEQSIPQNKILDAVQV